MNVSEQAISTALAGWLSEQRWYPGKSRASEVESFRLASLAGDPVPVEIWVARVHYSDGIEHYQIPLVFYPDRHAHLERAYVGSVTDLDTDRPVEVYDALHDKEQTGLWLEAIAAERSVDDLHFERVVKQDEIPVTETSLALSAEQSNTSLVYGDVAIMKVFRRIEPGLNPDIEVHAALSGLGGRHVARLLGHLWIERDGEQWSLAMLQEFMKTATDGWQVATSSVRDLMAEGDLHAEEAGADFAAEAARLGVAAAEVHADLAAAFTVAELSSADLQARSAAMSLRLDHALVEVPELVQMELGLRQAYADFAAYSGPVLAQRVHGDLHLGQVLRTVHRWVVLDFEGEPAKSIADRRALDSPLRDVAGMLRSFDYAARHQLIDIGATPQSEFRAAEWADRNRAAFCRGYAEAGGTDPASAAVLLRAFEADKAVYEAVYEARNRPHWLPIPLASLHRLAEPA